MCPGMWVISSDGRASRTTTWGVTPHAQNVSPTRPRGGRPADAVAVATGTDATDGRSDACWPIANPSPAAPRRSDEVLAFDLELVEHPRPPEPVGGIGDVSVQVFVGDREITDIVDVRLDDRVRRGRRLARNGG